MSIVTPFSILVDKSDEDVYEIVKQAVRDSEKSAENLDANKIAHLYSWMKKK